MSGLTASAKVYDSTTAATLTGTAALTGFEAPGAGTATDGLWYTGDGITVGGTPIGTFVSPNVGTPVGVTVSGLSLGNNSTFNDYTLTEETGLSANITPRGLTVTAKSEGKIYGQTLTFGSGSTQFTSSSGVCRSMILLVQ